MTLKKMKCKIDELESTCKLFINHNIEEKINDTVDIALKIKAFDELISECKIEIRQADRAHMAYVLKLLFNVRSTETNKDTIDSDLEKFINSQINNTSINVNEKSILSLQNLISNIDNVTMLINVKYEQCILRNKKWYIFNTNKIKTYELFLKKLKDLKENLEVRLELDSKEIAFFIVEGFYNSYIFFSFMINLAILEKQEFLLIELASNIQRYVNMIEPSFNHRVLEQKDLLYHYTIYELKELENKIFNYLNY